MSLESVVAAALLFFLSSWLTRYLSSPGSRLSLLDYPNERSLHVKPTPRTGGVAVLGSLFIGFLVTYAGYALGWFHWRDWSHTESVQMEQILWILLLTLCIATVSFVDDRVGVPPGLRFGVHGVIASMVVVGIGVGIDFVEVPLLGTWVLGDAAAFLTILYIMWIVNLYNFMDGMDGFAGGMAVVGFSFLGGTAWVGGHDVLGIFTWFIAAATGGFLIFNVPPARIFLGDVGSVSLGFLVGTLSVIGVHSGAFEVWVPILIFSPFIVDATVTLFLRLLQGKKIWLPHREHYYQRLVLCGWGSQRTVWAEYVLMVVCGSCGVLYEVLGDGARLVLLCAWVMLYGSLIIGVGLLERKLLKVVPNL